MSLIVCNDFGKLLSNPTIKSESFIGFDEKKLIEHVENCEKCKKSLKMFYDEKSKDFPFALKVLSDKFINKIIGE